MSHLFGNHILGFPTRRLICFLFFLQVLYLAKMNVDAADDDEPDHLETADEANITEMLELQMSEVEMLRSMFPDTKEFKLDDPMALVNIQGFLSGSIKYEYLYDRIGFTVHLEIDCPKVC